MSRIYSTSIVLHDLGRALWDGIKVGLMIVGAWHILTCPQWWRP